MSSNRENRDPMEDDDDDWGDDDYELVQLTQLMEERHLATSVANPGQGSSTSTFGHNSTNAAIIPKQPKAAEDDKLVTQLFDLTEQVTQLGDANKNLRDNNYILQGEISTLRRKLEQFTAEKQRIVAEKISTISQLRSQEDKERKKAVSEIDALKSDLQFCKNEITQLTIKNRTLHRKNMDANQSISAEQQLSQSQSLSPPISSHSHSQSFHRGPGRQLVAGPPPQTSQASQKIPGRPPSKRFPNFYDVNSAPVVSPASNLSTTAIIGVGAMPPPPAPQRHVQPYRAAVSIQTEPIATSTIGIETDLEVQAPECSDSPPFLEFSNYSGEEPKLEDSVDKEFTSLLPLISETCRAHLVALNQDKQRKRLATGLGLTTLNALAGLVNYMNDRDLETLFPRVESDTDYIRSELVRRREAEEKGLIEEEVEDEISIVEDFNIPTQHHPYHQQRRDAQVQAAVTTDWQGSAEKYPTDFDSEDDDEPDEDHGEIEDYEGLVDENLDGTEAMEEDVNDENYVNLVGVSNPLVKLLQNLPGPSSANSSSETSSSSDLTPEGIPIIELLHKSICNELLKGKMGKALTIIKKELLRLLRHIRGRQKEYLFSEFDRLKLFMLLLVWSSRLIPIYLSRAQQSYIQLKGMKKWTKIFLEIVWRKTGTMNDFRKSVRYYFFNAMASITRYGYFDLTEFHLNKLTEIIKNSMNFRWQEKFDLQIIEIVYNLSNEPLLYQKLCLENRRDLYKENEECLLRIILKLFKHNFYKQPQKDDVQLNLFQRYMKLFISLNSVKRITKVRKRGSHFEISYHSNTSTNDWLCPKNWQVLTNGVEDTRLCKCRKEFILFGMKVFPLFWERWEKNDASTSNLKTEHFIEEGRYLRSNQSFLENIILGSKDDLYRQTFRKIFTSCMRLHRGDPEISVVKLAEKISQHNLYKSPDPNQLPENRYDEIIQFSFEFLVFMYNKCDNICESYGYEIVPDFWVLLGNYVKHYEQLLTEAQISILQLMAFDQELFSHKSLPILPEDQKQWEEEIKNYPFLNPSVPAFTDDPKLKIDKSKLKPPKPITNLATTHGLEDWINEAADEDNEFDEGNDVDMT